ncbi:MAG: hypothetical protein ACC700_21040 [Anaerolineales bacterium]
MKSWDWDISIKDLTGKIKKNQEIKDKGLVLPYTQQIQALNTCRNLAQHSALGPDLIEAIEFGVQIR